MQIVEAPYLEIGFYFGNAPEESAFIGLLRALTTFGFQLGNRGYVHAGIEDQEYVFASINDKVRREVPINSWIDVDSFFTDPNIRLVQVVMNDMVNNEEIVVTYVSISPEAAHRDRHPIAIWSSGELFSGSLTQLYEKRAKEKGKEAYQLLKALITIVRPCYATITVEEPIRCPTDLAHDPRSYAFRDFYVKGTFLGSPGFTQIKEIFRSAYTESLEDGIYVSCYEYFNPEGQGINNTLALDKSVHVAKLIAVNS